MWYTSTCGASGKIRSGDQQILIVIRDVVPTGPKLIIGCLQFVHLGASPYLLTLLPPPNMNIPNRQTIQVAAVVMFYMTAALVVSRWCYFLLIRY